MKDSIDRLRPLGVTLLALLVEGDMHPYELIQLMRHRWKDRLLRVTNGAVYHSVGRLEDDGFVTAAGVDRDGNRPERTTYAITDAGRAAVVEWTRRRLPRIDRPVEFRVALDEAHNLSRREVGELLRVRRGALSGALDLHQYALERMREQEEAKQHRLEVEREEALLSAELEWLDGLIAQLDHDDLPWGSAWITNSTE